jgi:hypothetical protein
MKLLDIINEDYTPEQLKELKSAKSVLLFFKKGAVRFTNVYNEEEYIVKYELRDSKFTYFQNYNKDEETANNFHINVKDLTVYITDQDLYDSIVTNPNRMQDVRGQLVYNYILPKIKDTFIRHKVRIYIVNPNVNFILVQPEKSEEREAINEEVSDNDKKKCRILFDQFKSGIVTLDDQKYKYHLKNEYEIMTTQYTPMPVIEIIGRFDNSIRVYEIVDNGHLTLMDYGVYNTIYSKIKQKVKKRFYLHNVLLNL